MILGESSHDVGDAVLGRSQRTGRRVDNGCHVAQLQCVETILKPFQRRIDGGLSRFQFGCRRDSDRCWHLSPPHRYRAASVDGSCKRCQLRQVDLGRLLPDAAAVATVDTRSIGSKVARATSRMALGRCLGCFGLTAEGSVPDMPETRAGSSPSFRSGQALSRRAILAGGGAGLAALVVPTLARNYRGSGGKSSGWGRRDVARVSGGDATDASGDHAAPARPATSPRRRRRHLDAGRRLGPRRRHRRSADGGADHARRPLPHRQRQQDLRRHGDPAARRRGQAQPGRHPRAVRAGHCQRGPDHDPPAPGDDGGHLQLRP